jgi:hypothetical protein
LDFLFIGFFAGAPEPIYIRLCSTEQEGLFLAFREEVAQDSRNERARYTSGGKLLV